MADLQMSDNPEVTRLDELRNTFRDLSEISAPRALKESLLERAIHWYLQCVEHGIPKTDANIHLPTISVLEIDRGAEAFEVPVGTILVREWRGIVHEVRKAPSGEFVYRRRRFTSLSGVAEHITGCKRSGPKFFGLVEKAKRSG